MISLFFHFGKLLMFLLHNRVINFLLICINFSVPKNLITRILLFDRLNLTILHVIGHNDFFSHIINTDFCNLFLNCLFEVLLELSRHFLYQHFANMVVIICEMFRSVDFVLISFLKSDTLQYKPIISISIKLNGPFPNFLYSLHQSIWVSVGIVVNYPHSPVNLCNFFPMWHFAWTIVLDCLKLIRVTILTL